MELFHSPEQYLYNLHTTSSSEAKRIWKNTIKEKWNHQCAYCGSEDNLTLDHVIPQSKGGLDSKNNVICCCRKCNHSKGHLPWEDWYLNQDFFSIESYKKIIDWIKMEKQVSLYAYKKRRNNAS